MSKHCPGCSHPTICRTHGCAAQECRANSAPTISPAEQAIADLLELIAHAAGNGFDRHPDNDERVQRARELLRHIP